MSSIKFLEDINIMSPKELEKLKTRQLLAELRRTYTYDWENIEEYRNQIKTVLATREHIPNKQESKNLRKLRKKRGHK